MIRLLCQPILTKMTMSQPVLLNFMALCIVGALVHLSGIILFFKTTSAFYIILFVLLLFLLYKKKSKFSFYPFFIQELSPVFISENMLLQSIYCSTVCVQGLSLYVITKVIPFYVVVQCYFSIAIRLTSLLCFLVVKLFFCDLHDQGSGHENNLFDNIYSPHTLHWWEPLHWALLLSV